MHSCVRPRGRDWVVGLVAGAVLGLLFLGIGARAGMRLVAIHAGQPGIFTLPGSLTVSALGALAGSAVAVIFLLARTAFPAHRWRRALAFWAVCVAIVLRGLHPVTSTNAAIFLPLFAAHGALMHVFWCRVYLLRSASWAGRT